MVNKCFCQSFLFHPAGTDLWIKMILHKILQSKSIRFIGWYHISGQAHPYGELPSSFFANKVLYYRHQILKMIVPSQQLIFGGKKKSEILLFLTHSIYTNIAMILFLLRCSLCVIRFEKAEKFAQRTCYGIACNYFD